MALSTQGASASFVSNESAPRWKYDVFLSFRGVDTRKGFVSHLYHELCKCQGITTFFDDRELEGGTSIHLELPSAIKESHIAIVVLSPNYASSKWCLNELTTILQCMEARNSVLPVFYETDPSDVGHQTGSYAKAFDEHEEKFISTEDKMKVTQWRKALEKVSKISGWHSKESKCERELIEKLVQCVWRKVQATYTLLDSSQKFVGVNFRLEQLSSLLDHAANDVRKVSKTTLAKLVSDKIFHHLGNVRKVSKINQNSSKKVQEAMALATEESAKSKAAKEVIKSLTAQLKDLAEPLPPGVYDTETIKKAFLPNGLEPNGINYPDANEERHSRSNSISSSYLISSLGIDSATTNGNHVPTHSPKDPLGTNETNVQQSRELLTSNKLPNSGGSFQSVSSSVSETVDGKESGPFQDGENGARSKNSPSPANGNTVEAEWIEQYEPGVYITLVVLRDWTRYLKRVRFSRRRFGEQQAVIWWSENREKVYEKYNVRRSDKSSVAGSAARSGGSRILTLGGPNIHK